jgi:ParB family chromosome partitioning protein
LLDLPSNISDLIANSTISPSSAVELASMKDKQKQLELAVLTEKKRLSVKMIREISRNYDDGEIFSSSDTKQMRDIPRTFDKCIIGLRLAMNRLITLIELVNNNWLIHDLLMEHKNLLHAQIDLMIKQKKRFIHSESLFQRFNNKN